jgi:hypothetical protein
MRILDGELVSDTTAIRIASIRYEGDYRLYICWVSGKTNSVDLREPVFRLKGMRPLRDKAIFAQAAKGAGGHSVVWPGEIDVGAGRLWEVTSD